MLPFLKSAKESKEASVSAPVDRVKRDPDEEQAYDPLESAASDLIDAFHSKDVKGVALALRAAFELCDSDPHVEGHHTQG